MGKQFRDVVGGVVLLAFALFYRIAANDIRVFTGMGATWISARTIPFIWSYILMFLSTLLVVRGVRGCMKAKKAGGPEAELHVDAMGWLKENYAVVGTFILLAAYAYTMSPIGYVISTMVYVFLQTLLLTPRNLQKKAIIPAVILAVVFTLITYYLFRNVLSIYLPQGILKFV